MSEDTTVYMPDGTTRDLYDYDRTTDDGEERSEEEDGDPGSPEMNTNHSWELTFGWEGEEESAYFLRDYLTSLARSMIRPLDVTFKDNYTDI